MSAASARMQMDMRGRGTFGSLCTRTCDLVSHTVRATQTDNALDGSRETLVTLRVVVLEADLKLNRLDEIPLLLAVGLSQ